MASKEKVRFTIPADIIHEATVAILLGDFNNWNPEEGIYLDRQEDGSFSKVLELEGGEYQYRYYLNDGRWVNDHNYTVASPAYGDSIRNCIIQVQVQEEVHFPEDAGAVTETKAEGHFPEDDAEGKTVGHAPLNAEDIVVEKKAAKKPAKETKSKKEVQKTAPVVNSGMFSKQYHELTKIEGITSEIEDILYKADLRTYGALAKASIKRLKDILKSAGKRYADVKPNDWPKEARKLSGK